MSDRKNIEKATKLNEFLIAKGYNPDEMSLEEKKAVGHNILLEGSLLGGGYCVFEYLNVEFQTGLLFLPTSAKESKQIGRILKLPNEEVIKKFFPGLKVGDIAIL